MRMGITILLGITAESVLVYALLRLICKSMPAFGAAHDRRVPVKRGLPQVLPLEFVGPASTLVWSASRWNHYAYDALAMTPRASARWR
jgi:hypothetical protein